MPLVKEKVGIKEKQTVQIIFKKMYKNINVIYIIYIVHLQPVQS